jgi:hypothetical protein
MPKTFEEMAQAYENDFLPGWEVSKHHHSKEAQEEFLRVIAAKKKMLAEFKAKRDKQ